MKTAIKIFFSTLILIICVLFLYTRDTNINCSVIIEATIQKDDVFQIFYLKEGIEVYDEAFSLKHNISGSPEVQTITFELPPEHKIKKLRVDIGQNEKQSEVKLYSISIIIDNKEKIYKQKQIYNKFTPNNFISLDKDSLTLSLVSVNNKYDPYLESVDFTELNDSFRNKIRLKKFSLGLLVFTLTGLLAVLGYYFRGVLNSIIFSSLFLVVLLVPFAWSLMSHDDNDTSNLEKRKLVEKPDFYFKEIEEYPEKFEAYFNDNFGFRSTLIAWGGMLKLKYFKSSINLDKVALGNDNWLFLSGSYNNIINDFSRRNLYVQEELTRMVDNWESKEQDLASKNIGYYKGFWPNKHTIYPEKLPLVIRMQPIDTVSRLDQVINYINESGSTIKLIDARKELIYKKKNNQLYYKHDTHWNEYGAFIASSKLINEIAKDYPQIESLNINEFRIEWSTIYAGDLTRMLGIKESNDYKDEKPSFIPIDERNEFSQLSTEEFPERSIITQKDNCTNDLTVLIFRDSFTTSMVKFISTRFKNIIYIYGLITIL